MQSIASLLSTLEENVTPLQSSVIMAQMHMRLNDVKMMPDKSEFDLNERAACLMARWEVDWKELEKEWNSNCDRKRQPFKHSFAATRRVAPPDIGGCSEDDDSSDDEDPPYYDDPSDDEDPPDDGDSSDNEDPPNDDDPSDDDDSSNDGDLSNEATALILHKNFTGGLKRKASDLNAAPASTLPATLRRSERKSAPRRDFKGGEWVNWGDLRKKRPKKAPPLPHPPKYFYAKHMI